MNPIHSKASFLLVGAMFAGVWALGGWLAMVFGFFTRHYSSMPMPHWMLTTFGALGAIFTLLGGMILLYRRRILRGESGGGIEHLSGQ